MVDSPRLPAVGHSLEKCGKRSPTVRKMNVGDELYTVARRYDEILLNHPAHQSRRRVLKVLRRGSTAARRAVRTLLPSLDVVRDG